MSNSGAGGSDAAAARQLLIAVRDSLRHSVSSVLVTAIVGFLAGWLLNIVLMAWRYEGYAVSPGSPVTGQGSMITGSIFWLVASTMVFGVIGYRRAVGRQRFWADVKSLPGVFSSMLRQDGSGARIHLLWGFAVAMILQQFISPSLAALLGVGVALSIPTLLGRIAMGLATSFFSATAKRIAPAKRVRIPPITAMAVGMLGTVGALLLGFVINGPLPLPGPAGWVDIRLLIGVGAGVVAWILTTRGRASGSAAMFMLAFASPLLAELASPATAWADDGGWDECGGTLFGWLTCGDGGPVTVAILSAAGGVAAGAGAVLGSGIGAVLGSAGLVGGIPSGPDATGGGGSEEPRPRDEGFTEPTQRPAEPAGDPGWTRAPDGKGGRPDWAPPGTVMNLPGGNPGPIVFDEFGDPLPTNENGQVKFGGEWLNPQEAVSAVAHWTAQHQDQARQFDADTNQATQRWREQVHDEARKAQQDLEARENARKVLDQIKDVAGRRGYDDIVARTWGDRSIDQQGNLDPGYVDELRDVLRRRIGRDVAVPAADPGAPGWIAEGAADTWNDARNSMIVRGGAGILTGGVSEIAFQGADVVDRIRNNVDKAVDEGKDYGFGDAMRDTATEFANQNLPVNTVKILLENRQPPPSASELLIALGTDVLAGVDVADSVSRVRTKGLDFGQDSMRDLLNSGRKPPPDIGVPTSHPDVKDFTKAPEGSAVPVDRLSDFGVPEQNMRHANQVADRHLVDIQVRPSNPDTVRWLAEGAHPKPPDLKSKTINEIDTYLMPGGRDANIQNKGTVGYFEPTLPDNLNQLPSDLQEKIVNRHSQRADEFADQAAKYHKLEKAGKITIGSDGMIRHGADNKPFTGDHDLWQITGAGGEAVPPAVKEQVVRDLAGPPFSAQHGAHTDWTPTTDVDRGIDARIRDSHNPGKEGLLTAKPGYGTPTVTYNRPPGPDTEMSHLRQQLRDEQITAATGSARPTGVMAGIEVPPKGGILSGPVRDALTGHAAAVNAASQTGAEGAPGWGGSR